jgi:hypothetical protein
MVEGVKAMRQSIFEPAVVQPEEKNEQQSALRLRLFVVQLGFKGCYGPSSTR